MNKVEYGNMINLLIKVTDGRLLQWTEIEDGYSTTIGKCKVSLSSIYDTDVNINEYNLQLYNSEGRNFEGFSCNESDGEYPLLEELYNSVRDSIFHIKESEKNIMDNLEAMAKKIPEDDGLPF